MSLDVPRSDGLSLSGEVLAGRQETDIQEVVRVHHGQTWTLVKRLDLAEDFGFNEIPVFCVLHLLCFCFMGPTRIINVARLVRLLLLGRCY